MEKQFKFSDSHFIDDDGNKLVFTGFTEAIEHKEFYLLVDIIIIEDDSLTALIKELSFTPFKLDISSKDLPDLSEVKYLRLDIPLDYKIVQGECYKCKNPMPFTLHNQRNNFYQELLSSLKTKNFDYKYSFTAEESYYVNVCDKCDVIQGDWFTYHEPDGVGFGEYSGYLDIDYINDTLNELNDKEKKA